MTPPADEAPARWPAHAARERVLRELEAAIAATPEALDTRFYYASFLRDHGRYAEALATFASILERAPEHADTLVAYGVLLARVGRRLAARAAFERAVAADPAHRGARLNLAHTLALDDPERARALYEAQLAVEPGAIEAHRGLCTLAAARGDVAEAARHRAAGYGPTPFGRRPYLGAGAPIGVLALVSTDGGNIPRAALLDERVFLVHELYVEAYDGRPLPPHAVVVNAIGDADRAGPALRRAADLVATLRAPILNRPEAVAATGRIANAVRLGRLPGVVAPAAWELGAGEVPAGVFPLIVRAPGLHMGRGMQLVANPGELERARARPDHARPLLAIPYVETRSPDGTWRKFRMMAVDGRLYPLHLAIARRWDVHYFSAAMADEPAFRDEEARFLIEPRRILGERAWAALEEVRDCLGLDYAGVDFALLPDGRVVVFEANAAMTVLGPDDDPRFAYRQPAAESIAAALLALVRKQAAAEH